MHVHPFVHLSEPCPNSYHRLRLGPIDGRLQLRARRHTEIELLLQRTVQMVQATRVAPLTRQSCKWLCCCSHGLTLNDPIGDLAHKSRGDGSTAFLILNCYHCGFSCKRPVAVLELYSIFELQRKRGGKQCFLRSPEFDNCLLAQRDPLLETHHPYRDPHRAGFREKLRQPSD